jgi:hypothetical protein
MLSVHDRDRELESALCPRESRKARQRSDTAVVGAWLAGHLLRVEETTHLSGRGMLADGTQVSKRHEATTRPG